MNGTKQNKAAETNIKLRQIQEAIEKAAGNKEEEDFLLGKIAYAQEPEICESCQ